MRLIDADELLINVWRDKPGDTVSIAKMINDAHTIKDIPTKEDAEPIVDMDMTKGLILGLLLTSDEKGKWMDAIKKVSASEQNKEVLDKIKAEILDLDYLVDSAKYSDSETRCHNVDYLVSEILKIIDRHISAEGSKE